MYSTGVKSCSKCNRATVAGFFAVLVVIITLILVPPIQVTADDAQFPQFWTRLKLLSNAGWLEVGAGSATGYGISGSIGHAGSPTIALLPDGKPCVAWHNRVAEVRQIYIRCWDGSLWAEVRTGSATGGGISDSTWDSWTPSIAIAANGTIYVAWHESMVNEVYVLKWDGAQWTEVGAGSASGSGISNSQYLAEEPYIALGPDGNPYVVWQNTDSHSAKGEIFVRRWDGNQWVEVGSGSASGGGISNTPYGDSYYPAIAIDPNGTPYVVWQETQIDDAHIYIRRWNGSAWVEIGPESASNGGISKGSAYSFQPALAIAEDNTPYVAWEEYLDGIYVLHWNGNEWKEVGSGSASGTGISQGFGTLASIAIDSNHHPYVVWTSNNSAVYARRWNGSSWEEIGNGSASAEGIDDTDVYVTSPSVTVSPDGIPYVTWEAFTDPNAIYVRLGPATLFTSPTRLAFLMQSDTEPSAKQIYIDSSAGGISWTATISPTVSWLSITPASGTTPAVVTATATISDATFGIYDTHIIVEASVDTLNSLQTIDVKLVMTPEIHRFCLPMILRSN